MRTAQFAQIATGCSLKEHLSNLGPFSQRKMIVMGYNMSTKKIHESIVMLRREKTRTNSLF